MSSLLSKKKINTYLEFFIFGITLTLLLLTALNIASFLKPKKVLGASTQRTISEAEFWQSFLSKNPGYVPGLIESGDLAKAKEIDPNYQLP